MSGSSVEQHIDTVDAYARTLYIRTRQNPSLSDIGDAVHQIHVALRHLRVEAADPDSLLANPESIYSRQLRPLVDSCSNTLGQLEDALESGSGLSTARSRLRGEKASIDGFLDAVQLQKSKAVVPVIVNTDQSSLERIKDKVDDVAKRVFSRRDSGFADDEDRVWKEFKAELEKEGFSPTVLKQHKDVLRAYIRGLESLSLQNGGNPPTVRGLLEYEAESNKMALQSPKELVYPDIENEKFSPSVKAQRRAADGDIPPPLPPKEPLPELESPPPLPPRHSPSPESSKEAAHDDSMALISTTDIMAMDRLDASMANMHLDARSQQQHQLPSSPNPKYLPWHVAGSLMPPDVAELPGSLSTSPQVAPMPNYPHLGTSPNGQAQARLAPDRYGKEIPMSAQWTKINRNLVSPEVLERAGVRYEARPTYVAILGRLSREQITEFARQSADCRAARAKRESSFRKDEPPYAHLRTDSKSSRDDELTDSDLFDESDTTDSDDDRTSEKGTKSYPYIVSPPDKTSPAATVKPKSILKNRNENHVRFDPQPHEVSNKSPNSRDERRSRRPEERRRPQHRHRERDSRDNYYYRSGGGGGSGSEYASDRHRPRSHYDDREHHHHRRPASHRSGGDREKKSSKKKAWGETLGAVGLGGAAVSLLSVLAEAASAV